MDLDPESPTAMLDQSRHAEIAKDGKTGDDAYYTSSPVSSSFTPINHHPTQLPTPCSSTTTPVQQNQARGRAGNSSTRQRNPTVARYLGLGSANQLTSVESDATPSTEPDNSPPNPVRKRARETHRSGESNHKRTIRAKGDISTQTQISESFHVTKPARKSARDGPKQATYEASQPECLINPQKSTTSYDRSNNSLVDQSSHVPQTDIATTHAPNSTSSLGDEARTAPDIVDSVNPLVPDLESDDFNSSFLAQFEDSPLQNDTETPWLDDGDFENDISDSDLLMLTCATVNSASSSVDTACESPAQSDISASQNRHNLEAGSSIQTAIDLQKELRISSSQRSLKSFNSPATLTTRLLAATGDLNSSKTRKAIVRPPFPTPVRDRSPIIGLSSSTLLRTCFRIGEAINQSCQASKSGKCVIIELFARVVDSERTGTKQHFTFCDLFHVKPPHIKAMYDATIWKSVRLFEYDSRRLLEPGRICRCMGTMKREDKEWTMTVLNIWEATWEDVNWVEGIVGA